MVIQLCFNPGSIMKSKILFHGRYGIMFMIFLPMETES